MKFIEALKLRSKLFFLFVLITFGLISVGIMGAININSMKKNLDSLYFGSLVPVNELNEILQTYHGTLATTIHRAKSSEISPSQISTHIKVSLKKINTLWQSYESHYKRDEELDYTEYVSLEIKETNDYFLKILKASDAGEDLEQISISALENNLSHIHTVIQKLIKYEVEIARFERHKFLDKYDSTIVQLGLILLFIVAGVLLISYKVFRSIQTTHTKLELAGRKLKKANKMLENASYTDSLTNIYNRRYFNITYDREFKRAKRENEYLTFMMLDIDYFKQYNDTYGHIEGDSALKSVANILKETLQRPGDFIFRLGGEEFGVLFSQLDEKKSELIAKNICDAVREAKIKHRGSLVNEFLTISIGVVCCKVNDTLNEDLLISFADKMLYSAKENGRNRYEIGSDVNELSVHPIIEQI